MHSQNKSWKQRFAEVRVAVLGDAMLDAYTTGAVNRFCPEGPVPVYDMQTTRYFCGGAANTANNLAALGAQVQLITAVGDDDEAVRLIELLHKARTDTASVRRTNQRRTLCKHRLSANQQLLMRVDHGTTDLLSETDEAWVIEQLDCAYRDCQLILISDYGYGSLTPRIVDYLSDRPAGVTLCIDSKRLEQYAAARPDIVKPNYAQACRLLGLGANEETRRRCEQMVRHRDRLLAVTGARVVALTCDQDGCVCLQANEPALHVPAKSCHRPRVAGAGDTFVATMALATTAGETLASAARLASLAASCVVGKEGTAACTADELERCDTGRGRSWDLHSLAAHLHEEREHGQRIVLTCGCFDILHHGHVEYLQKARSLGDRLIVAVNTDESIRRLKGPDRPINPLGDRLEVLAALDCVDFLLTFDDDQPHKVIAAIRPDVFVKGGDYSRATLPEAELVERLGGEVQFVPLVANRSTTRIIDRILGSSSITPNSSVTHLT